MAYGQGEIREKKDKGGKSYSPRKWEVVANFGKDPETGKRQRVKRVVQGTKTDANKVLAQLLTQLQSGWRAQGARMTFSEYAQGWHEERVRKGEHQTRTLEMELLCIRRINEVIGETPLNKITAVTVERTLAAIQQGHKGKNGQGLTGTTMHHTAQVLSQIMKDAVRHDLIMRNPCDKVDKPRVDTPEKAPLSESEFLALIETLDKCEAEEYAIMAAKEQRMQDIGKRFTRGQVRGVSNLSYIIALRIAAATGLRTGEVLGLRWMDVKIAVELVGGKPRYSGVITVAQSITNKMEIKKPKNKTSIRTVTLDEDTAKHLSEWRQAQGAALRTLGIVRGGESPVCCSDVGGYIGTGNYSRWRIRWMKDNGIPYFTPHQLRHTQATRLLAAGTDAVTVANRLGHSTPSTTLTVYAHWVPENDIQAAELVGEFMHPKPREKGAQTA